MLHLRQFRPYGGPGDLRSVPWEGEPAAAVSQVVDDLQDATAFLEMAFASPIGR